MSEGDGSGLPLSSYAVSRACVRIVLAPHFFDATLLPVFFAEAVFHVARLVAGLASPSVRLPAFSNQVGRGLAKNLCRRSGLRPSAQK